MHKTLLCFLLCVLLCFAPAFAESTGHGDPSVEFATRQSSVTEDGADNINAQAYPYSAIACLQGRFECGCTATGTGFMIGRNALLTAARSTVCPEHNSPLTYMNFYFGCRDGAYLTAYTGTYDCLPDAASAQDWCCIVFAENIGMTTGWFGLKSLSDADTESGVFTVAGYDNGSLTANAGSASVLNAAAAEIPMCGNDGSPVLDADGFVCALLTGASAEGGSLAYRINGDMANLLRAEGILETMAADSTEGTDEPEIAPQGTDNAMAAPQTATVYGADGTSNIRTAPNLDGAVIGQLPLGESAAYLNDTQYDSRGVAWYNIEYDGMTGWVSSKYTSLEGAGGETFLE